MIALLNKFDVFYHKRFALSFIEMKKNMNYLQQFFPVECGVRAGQKDKESKEIMLVGNILSKYGTCDLGESFALNRD